jgi:DNA-3-methyladenine glycosylase
LYGPPGFSYVYLNYGVHHLVNAVTEGESSPAAVLIRALQPIEGVHAMRRRRVKGDRTVPDEALCRGPGNLTVALGISLKENRLDLTRSRLTIEDHGLVSGAVSWGPRVGIRVGVDHPWRAWATGNPCVSGSPRMRRV